MGKKPVLGMIGLVWAGIALTGCGECCRSNCRNKYHAQPSYSSTGTSSPVNAATPPMIGDARSGKSATPTPAGTESSGTTGFATTGPQGTAPGQTGSGTASLPVSSPSTQSSLRASEDRPTTMSKLPEGVETSKMPSLPGEPAATIGSESKGFSMPPRPVVGSTSTSNSVPISAPVPPGSAAEVPSAGGSPLPAIGAAGSLPAPPPLPSSDPPLPPSLSQPSYLK